MNGYSVFCSFLFLPPFSTFSRVSLERSSFLPLCLLCAVLYVPSEFRAHWIRSSRWFFAICSLCVYIPFNGRVPKKSKKMIKNYRKNKMSRKLIKLPTKRITNADINGLDLSLFFCIPKKYLDQILHNIYSVNTIPFYSFIKKKLFSSLLS